MPPPLTKLSTELITNVICIEHDANYKHKACDKAETQYEAPDTIEDTEIKEETFQPLRSNLSNMEIFKEEVEGIV